MILYGSACRLRMKYMQRQITALMWAAEYGHIDCLRLLIDAGAEMNAQEQSVRVVSASLLLEFDFSVVTVGLERKISISIDCSVRIR